MGSKIPRIDSVSPTELSWRLPLIIGVQGQTCQETSTWMGQYQSAYEPFTSINQNTWYNSISNSKLNGLKNQRALSQHKKITKFSNNFGKNCRRLVLPIRYFSCLKTCRRFIPSLRKETCDPPEHTESAELVGGAPFRQGVHGFFCPAQRPAGCPTLLPIWANEAATTKQHTTEPKNLPMKLWIVRWPYQRIRGKVDVEEMLRDNHPTWFSPPRNEEPFIFNIHR